MKERIDSLDSISHIVDELKESICDEYNSGSISHQLDSIESAIEEVKETAEAAREAAERTADDDSGSSYY